MELGSTVLLSLPLQVGVEDWKVGVVLVEDVRGGALDGDVPDGVAAGLAVGRADHFDAEPERNFVALTRISFLNHCRNLLRGAVSDLDEEDREVVDEDEGGGEAVGELHDVVVGHPAPLLASNDLSN